MRASIEQSCAEADIDPRRIRSQASDCGKGSPEAAKRLADLGAVAHDLMPDIDVLKDRIDMAALLGALAAVRRCSSRHRRRSRPGDEQARCRPPLEGDVAPQKSGASTENLDRPGLVLNEPSKAANKE